MASGVLIRHFFNLRHKGRVEWRYPVAGVALLLAVAVAIAPKAPVAAPATAKADFATIQTIVTARCVSCHSAAPTQPGFASAPAGVMLHTEALIRQNAQKIHQQSVQLKTMPIANLTKMTDSERAQIAAWFEAGAK